MIFLLIFSDALRKLFQFILGKLRKMLQIICKFSCTVACFQTGDIRKKACYYCGEYCNCCNRVYRKDNGDYPPDQSYSNNISVTDGCSRCKAEPKTVLISIDIWLTELYRNCRYKEPQNISADNFVCTCCLESIFQKPEHFSFLSYCSHLKYTDNEPEAYPLFSVLSAGSFLSIPITIIRATENTAAAERNHLNASPVATGFSSVTEDSSSDVSGSLLSVDGSSL